VSDTETDRAVRAELAAWIDQHLPAIRGDDADALSLPVVVDFILIAAVEDGSDPDSDTWYSLVSSDTSHYRKVGLASVLQRIYLRSEDE
jgi:hypothetical protein